MAVLEQAAPHVAESTPPDQADCRKARQRPGQPRQEQPSALGRGGRGGRRRSAFKQGCERSRFVFCEAGPAIYRAHHGCRRAREPGHRAPAPAEPRVHGSQVRAQQTAARPAGAAQPVTRDAGRTSVGKPAAAGEEVESASAVVLGERDRRGRGRRLGGLARLLVDVVEAPPPSPASGLRSPASRSRSTGRRSWPRARRRSRPRLQGPGGSGAAIGAPAWR